MTGESMDRARSTYRRSPGCYFREKFGYASRTSILTSPLAYDGLQTYVVIVWSLPLQTNDNLIDHWQDVLIGSIVGTYCGFVNKTRCSILFDRSCAILL
jgi:hypothetical protein